MPNPNKVVVDSLLTTFQRKDPRLYDALRKISDDLNLLFNTLIDGPLGAVNASALTNLTAENLIGLVPRDSFDTDFIAFTDLDNEFTIGQSVVNDDPYFLIGFEVNELTPPTQYFRFNAFADGDFFIGHNFLPDSTRDDDTSGALALEFINGALEFIWFDGTDFINTFRFDGKEFLVTDFDQVDLISLFLIDDNDIIHLGESAESTGKAHIAIPNKLDTDLPTADAILDGIIMIDRVNHRLCFYTDGNRYRLNGTAF